MKDTAYYQIAGIGGSAIAKAIGIIEWNGLLNAFLFGCAGALGGMLIKYVKDKTLKRWKKSKESS